jgi:hypothetical protein
MVRRRVNLLWFGLIMLILVTMVSCKNGGGSGVTGPSPTLSSNVSGTWTFSGAISSNNCAYLQGDPTFAIGQARTEMIHVTQNGSNLTASHTGGNIFSSSNLFSGTVNGTVFTLAMSNPTMVSGGNCTAALGGGMEVQRTTDTSGSGSVNITTVQAGGDCAFLGALPCSVVYTGTWTRTSTTKLESQEPSRETPMIEQLQQIITR